MLYVYMAGLHIVYRAPFAANVATPDRTIVKAVWCWALGKRVMESNSARISILTILDTKCDESCLSHPCMATARVIIHDLSDNMHLYR